MPTIGLLAFCSSLRVQNRQLAWQPGLLLEVGLLGNQNNWEDQAFGFQAHPHVLDGAAIGRFSLGGGTLVHLQTTRFFSSLVINSICFTSSICRAEVLRSFNTSTVWDESQVTPQGRHR